MNAINLKQLTLKSQKITKNNLHIGQIEDTSNYDIPYYVTDNKLAYSFYKWRVKRNINMITIKYL